MRDVVHAGQVSLWIATWLVHLGLPAFELGPVCAPEGDVVQTRPVLVETVASRARATRADQTCCRSRARTPYGGKRWPPCRRVEQAERKLHLVILAMMPREALRGARHEGGPSMTKKQRQLPFAVMAAQAKMAEEPDDPWKVAYFKRLPENDSGESVPARDYIWKECPTSVAAFFSAVIVEVAKAPPPKFVGGGYWEAMHGDLAGFHEIRKKYRGLHYRVFCRLDTESTATPPLLTLLCGRTKPDGTVFSDDEYAEILALGKEYLATNPRSVVL